jgi:hypothetical protein
VAPPVVVTPTPPVVVTPSPPTTPALPAQAFLLTTTVDSSNLGQSQFPFVTASFVASGAFSVSTPFYGYRAASTAGSTPNDPRAFQANFALNGRGASQTSMISVATGDINNDPINGQTFIGNFFGTTRQSASNAYNNFARGYITSTPNSIAQDSNYLPTGSFATTQNSFKSSTATVTNGYTNPPTLSYDSTNNVNYLTNQTISRVSNTPATLGADHVTSTLQAQGYVGGLAQTSKWDSTFSNFISASPLYVVTNANNQPVDVNLTLFGGSSKLEAVFNVAATTRSYPNGDPNFQANSIQTAQYRFGNPSTLPNGASGSSDNGAYVDSRTFAALSERQFNSSTPSQYTSSVNLGSNSAFDTASYNTPALPGGYNGRLYSLMVVSDVVGANTTSFLSSISSTTVSPCVCDYTRWGFWSLDGSRNDAINNNVYEDELHLGVWVAGVPTTAANIPLTGTATYTGHAIADISNAGNQYLSAGTFSNAVNFGTRQGAVAINGLDGTNYAGVVNLVGGTTTFSTSNVAPLFGNVGGRTAAVNGSFFQGGPANSTPLYGEMGGSLTFKGTNYLGSGIFAARKP